VSTLRASLRKYKTPLGNGTTSYTVVNVNPLPPRSCCLYHKFYTMIKHFLTILAIIKCSICQDDAEQLSIYPVIMPMIVPAQNEVYLCTSIDLSQTNETFWIRGFEPRVTDGRIHHMALAGSVLEPPKTRFNMWNCGNNGKPANDPNYPNHPLFPDGKEGEDTTLYLWGMGGKTTMLPKDVGFKIGANSRIKYLVIQVHYINIEGIDKNGDASGVYVYYTRKPQRKVAGMLSMHVDTKVPKFARSYQDVACRIEENKVLFHNYSAAHGHHLFYSCMAMAVFFVVVDFTSL
jgi:peptidylglycine monooxygenase